MLGVSISPPHGSIAENPTSSSTMYRTLGAPEGATGCMYGAQWGTESRTSMLMTPWNGLLMDLDLALVGVSSIRHERPVGRIIPTG
jgi:hypothetical protein